ncbi:MAG: DUF4037 domain-containing protein [Erysipelotrichaceae bacterium]|nr:DUF4037 domain-containing protein [Erysipelotrichaceae bacterium]
MIQELFNELSSFPEVEAIALGGSRSQGNEDEKSDYDIYIYLTSPLEGKKRETVLSRYCRTMEIGNHFWELEDNCILNDGIDIDLIYRSLDEFAKDLSSVVHDCQPRNCYTTCMWHNLKTCQIIYDQNGRLAKLQKHYDVSYPRQLKKNIIENNMKLLRYGLPSFERQILKAAARQDFNSVNHRTAEFMASYFDLLFALNEMSHPGEKRLVSICQKECSLLPEDFEENVDGLFKSLFVDSGKTAAFLNAMIARLEELLEKENLLPAKN